MKTEPKLSMPSYAREGFHSEHPVSRNQKDNKIRSISEEANGINHTVTRHGSPAKGYMAESVEGNKRPPRDNKISGMPPHQMDRFGVSEDSKGNGGMRNTEDCYNQKPKRGGMPMHGRVKAEGTK